MKHCFADLLQLSKTMQRKNHWHQEQTIQSWTKHVVEEAAEIQKAVRKKDWEELEEETGDLFWVLLCLARVAEKKRLFSIHDSIHSVHKKIVRRHPHVFDKNKTVTKKEWKKRKKELHQQYLAIKRKEKEKKKQRKKK
jgi:NTP pyrophosphatase (non-canonical NTP hydrolase)